MGPSSWIVRLWAKDQIRTVIRTFRDQLYTDIFPGRDTVPKTLIFAKDDSHAEDIVEIVRDEFGKGNEFCQKITSKSTGSKPEQLLQDFRKLFQSPHRRNRGHDCHRNRCETARNRLLHEEREEPNLLRADEGEGSQGDFPNGPEVGDARCK